MSFFKKLFSKKEKNVNPQDNSNKMGNVREIGTHEYFEKRYKETPIESSVLDNTLKMIESYYMDNKMERAVESPVNHPKNLDQIVSDGMGFHMYCQAFKMEDSMIVGILAMAFNSFMIDNLGFKTYKDSEPEFPMRAMTLKYDRGGTVLSLYPMEYALKVLNFEATFEDLYNRVETNLKSMPSAEEFINKITGKE